MKKALFAAFILLSLAGTAMASPITGDISIETLKPKNSAQQNIEDVNVYYDQEIDSFLSVHGNLEMNRINSGDQTIQNFNGLRFNDAYLEYKTKNYGVMAGKQSYALSNGMIADVAGITSFRVELPQSAGTVSLFAGWNADQNMYAAAFRSQKVRELDSANIDLNYFKDGNAYLGVTASKDIAPGASCSIDTVRNLDTQSLGYMVTGTVGQLKKKGDTQFAISYRNIESGAVSTYSSDLNYDNSKGWRVSGKYRLSNDAVITAYQDFAKSQTNTSINETDVRATWMF